MLNKLSSYVQRIKNQRKTHTEAARTGQQPQITVMPSFPIKLFHVYPAGNAVAPYRVTDETISAPPNAYISLTSIVERH